MNIRPNEKKSEMLLSDCCHEYEPNQSLQINNAGSRFCSFFRLQAPFQITYQFCSGITESDYMNNITMSGDNFSFSQENMGYHNFHFSKHAPHFHDYFEIMLVLDGTVLQRIEDKTYHYGAGACCLINRSLCHIETFSTSSSILFVGLSVEFIEELFASCRSSYFDREKEVLESKLYQFIVSDIKQPGQKAYLDFIPAYQNQVNGNVLHSFAEEMIRTILFPEFGSSYRIRGLLCRLLQYLSRPENYHCTCVKLEQDNDSLLFARIGHLLEENDGRITRTELESILNYSGNYLNRIVNKYTGMCLFDYGMTFCLKKAEYYLANTTDSIGTIASRLSFSNRTHFYTLFKERYGMTPNEYRKRNVQLQGKV